MRAQARKYSRKYTTVQRLRASDCPCAECAKNRPEGRKLTGVNRLDALTGVELLGRGEGIPLPMTKPGRRAYNAIKLRLQSRRRGGCGFTIEYVGIVIHAWETKRGAAVVSHRQFMELTGVKFTWAQHAQQDAEDLELVERRPHFDVIGPGTDVSKLRRIRHGQKHAERAYALRPGRWLLAELYKADDQADARAELRRARLAREVAELKAKDAARREGGPTSEATPRNDLVNRVGSDRSILPEEDRIEHGSARRPRDEVSPASETARPGESGGDVTTGGSIATLPAFPPTGTREPATPAPRSEGPSRGSPAPKNRHLRAPERPQARRSGGSEGSTHPPHTERATGRAARPPDPPGEGTAADWLKYLDDLLKPE